MPSMNSSMNSSNYQKPCATKVETSWGVDERNGSRASTSLDEFVMNVAAASHMGSVWEHHIRAV